MNTTDRRTHRNVNAAPVPDCHCQHCDRKRIKRSTFDLLGDGTVLLYGDKIKLWNVHPVEACAGKPCVLHNPTDHHMRSWRLHWRGDRKIFERLCPDHGTGHPDPDQFDYWDSTDQEWQSLHGCCGCCVRAKKGNDEPR